MRSVPTSISAVLGACLLAVSGCASTITGSGIGTGAPPVVSSAPPSSPAPSSPAGSTCPGDFCDDFGSTTSGWDTGNQKHFYSKYDPYLGGTFRMGERHDAVLTVPAPYDITQAAADDSVRIDVDMILGPNTAAHSIYGVSCWNHTTPGGETSAFLFYLTRSGAEIALWDNVDGSLHVLKRRSWTGVIRPAPYRNKVRAVCLQRSGRTGPVAELGVAVNGSQLTTSYSKSVEHRAWATGDRVGLLVGLRGSDIFYDDFVLTGDCKGPDC